MCHFRTAIGIDDSMGDGGYARPIVALQGMDNVELFTGPALRGSSPLADTKPIVIPVKNESQRLVLQVDPMNDERPDIADTLDIRDAVNWLEPLPSNSSAHQVPQSLTLG